MIATSALYTSARGQFCLFFFVGHGPGLLHQAFHLLLDLLLDLLTLVAHGDRWCRRRVSPGRRLQRGHRGARGRQLLLGQQAHDGQHHNQPHQTKQSPHACAPHAVQDCTVNRARPSLPSVSASWAAPPTHFITVSAWADDCSSAPMPSMDSPIRLTKPTAPPAMVHSVRTRPCSAPWASTSRLLGPGVKDSPMTANRETSHIFSSIAAR